MSFNGAAASAAIFQSSQNLINWLSLETNSPFKGAFVFDDPQAPDYPHRFYQILILP